MERKRKEKEEEELQQAIKISEKESMNEKKYPPN